jgi:hypothetical protein
VEDVKGDLIQSHSMSNSRKDLSCYPYDLRVRSTDYIRMTCVRTAEPTALRRSTLEAENYVGKSKPLVSDQIPAEMIKV